MGERLKVLVVAYGTPYPPNAGTRTRDFSLFQELARFVKLYLCVLATEGSSPDLFELNKFCAKIISVPAGPRTPVRKLANSLRLWARGVPVAGHRFFYPELAQKIRAIIEQEHIDVVQIEHSFLAAYRGAIPERSHCGTILSLHNVGSAQYLRMAAIQASLGLNLSYRLKSWLIRRLETRAATEFDHCIVVSAQEAHLLQDLAPSANISVVDNGVDCKQIQPIVHAPPTHHLLFVGVINYPPNADAILYFCKSILPLIRQRIPDVKFTVVGHSPPPEIEALHKSPGVVVAGPVEDLASHYAEARACVVPLRAGGGTRLKILEAMAFGRPVVSTSIGCEGLEVVNGVHLLIADSPDEFAHQVTRLLSDAGLWNRIAMAARRRVEKRYDWPILAQKQLKIYDALAAHGTVTQQ